MIDLIIGGGKEQVFSSSFCHCGGRLYLDGRCENTGTVHKVSDKTKRGKYSGKSRSENRYNDYK